MLCQQLSRSRKTLRVNMVLEREDERILGGLERTLSDGLNHILQRIKTRRTLLFSCHRCYKQETQISEMKLVAVRRAASPKYDPNGTFTHRQQRKTA